MITIWRMAIYDEKLNELIKDKKITHQDLLKIDPNCKCFWSTLFSKDLPGTICCISTTVLIGIDFAKNICNVPNSIQGTIEMETECYSALTPEELIRGINLLAFS